MTARVVIDRAARTATVDGRRYVLRPCNATWDVYRPGRRGEDIGPRIGAIAATREGVPTFESHGFRPALRVAHESVLRAIAAVWFRAREGEGGGR